MEESSSTKAKQFGLKFPSVTIFLSEDLIADGQLSSCFQLMIGIDISNLFSESIADF
ncbi:MAG TPA: hypothetical protein VHE99_05555 [Gammaproteobacteria bacterium]|nr:hypothetical protein [Gammaproteobacteria bacterium]